MNDSSELEVLSDDDEILACALAEGFTHAAAGALIGVSAKTVQRRLSNPKFAGAVGDRRRQRVSEVVGVLVSASRQAVQVLVEVLEGGAPADRLRAARMVLDYSSRYQRDQVLEDELARRVRVLEELASASSSDEWSVAPEPLEGKK